MNGKFVRYGNRTKTVFKRGILLIIRYFYRRISMFRDDISHDQWVPFTGKITSQMMVKTEKSQYQKKYTDQIYNP